MINLNNKKEYSIISDFVPYNELKKYLTGKMIEVPTITNTIGLEKRDGIGLFPEYLIPIGALINDFIEHKNKSWWKRKWYHDRLTGIYIEILNVLGAISYGF